VTLAAAKKIGFSLATIIVACLVLGLAIFALDRLWPRRDPLPAELARKDEKAVAGAAQAIGSATEARNRDANITIDLVTKDIRDAFDAIPAVPVPVGADPRPLPAAPVDRVRDRLNESVARANRAAGSSGAPD
jgi:hypothetical protein